MKLCQLRRTRLTRCLQHAALTTAVRTIRLLKWSAPNQLSLTKDFTDNIPPYAILSHVWVSDDEEVTFDDLCKDPLVAQSKADYAKTRCYGEQAQRDGIEHSWVDTCCINKDSHTELAEAITSMFRWCGNALKCYVYLPDVSARTLDNTSSSQHS